jgi:hypothetical protein
MRRAKLWAMMMLAGLASAPAAAQVPETPAAQVEANIVSHPGERLTVRVPRGATYVGGERFTLYDVADAEIHVFVEADAAKRIRRFYWVQFESYLPSRPDARYNYGESDRRMDLWGEAAWVRPSVADSARQVRAGSDTEHFRAILTRAGYTAPPHLLAVRMVRLLDDPQGTGQGRRELMLIYAEAMGLSGTTASEVLTGGRPNMRFAELEAPLIERAAAAFTVEGN